MRPVFRAALSLAGALSLALPAGAALAAAPAAVPATSPAATLPAQVATDAPFLVGVGSADITGKPGENGMMGYGDSAQKTSGIHMRQFARAYMVADPATDERVLLLTGDFLTGTNLVRQRVLERLGQRFGDRYTDANVMIAGTHTHATPGGTTDYSLYNVTTLGVHADTLEATVAGLVDAAVQADASAAPAEAVFGTTTLEGASANRSRDAWERNPQELQALTPSGSDTRSRTLSFRTQDGEVGAINWFATHPTSLPTDNTLISGDNKGYAEYLWEEERGSLGAFLMSNGADQSANPDLQPAASPAQGRERMYANGRAQYRAAATAGDQATALAQRGVDAGILWLDMQNQSVEPLFSTTGRTERTCRAILGAPFGAGSTEDGGGGASFLEEGKGNNPFFELLSRGSYRLDPALAACQAPKGTLFESGLIDGVQTTLPVQLLRIGELWIAALPGEVTTASGLMLANAVGGAVGASPDNVVITQAANAYGHYFTTPWEFDQQDYEGGATLFGRYTTPALAQGLFRLGEHLTQGTDLDAGSAPRIRPFVTSTVGEVWWDVPGTRGYGTVLTQPAAQAAAGETVTARFQGAHPNNDIRHGDTYLSVERLVDGQWQRVADDNDPETLFEWKRHLAAQSHITISWTVPQDAEAGTYRIRYFGTASSGLRLREFTGATREFTVTR